MRTALAIHGGAGLLRRQGLSAARLSAARDGLRAALAAGTEVLDRGGPAIEAVVAAVAILEDDPLFNAGRGGVLAADGTVQMDATLMDGRQGDVGALAAVRGVRHPILGAQAVLERSSAVLLAGSDAEAWLRAQGLRFEAPEWFVTDERRGQWERARSSARVALDHDLDEPGDGKGTVGAVALDADGHLAAATSTGGMTNKPDGRVGDSALAGAGTWAEDGVGAVSGTGEGEKFIRSALAVRVVDALRSGQTPAEAGAWAVGPLLGRVQGRGGLIVVDAQGRVALPFNTAGMYRAWRDGEGREGVGVFAEDGPGEAR